MRVLTPVEAQKRIPNIPVHYRAAALWLQCSLDSFVQAREVIEMFAVNEEGQEVIDSFYEIEKAMREQVDIFNAAASSWQAFVDRNAK